jgi:hypothetical protein
VEGFLKASGLCRRYKAKALNGGKNAGNMFELKRVFPRPEFGAEAVLITSV